MFICSLKASKIKFVLSAIVCVAFIATVIAFLPDTEHSVTVNGTQYNKDIGFDGIKDEEDIKKLAESLGYTLEDAPLEHMELKLPSKMDAVLDKYNELQKSQGFNLAKYKNKKVNRYTYIIKEMPESETLPESDVLFTVILYKDKVIGGDIYYTGKDARVLPLIK